MSERASARIICRWVHRFYIHTVGAHEAVAATKSRFMKRAHERVIGDCIFPHQPTTSTKKSDRIVIEWNDLKEIAEEVNCAALVCEFTCVAVVYIKDISLPFRGAKYYCLITAAINFKLAAFIWLLDYIQSVGGVSVTSLTYVGKQRKENNNINRAFV